MAMLAAITGKEVNPDYVVMVYTNATLQAQGVSTKQIGRCRKGTAS